MAWCLYHCIPCIPGRVLALVTHRTEKPSRGGPISTETRVNERIRVPEVRLIGPGGEQVGIVRIEDALRVAADADLDLVEVAPNARPPVCKIMDYGKYKYEAAQKARESRRNQQQTVVKEQKLRPKIDDHDYETKKGHVVRFLEAGSKVKVTIMFRGREITYTAFGKRLLDRIAKDLENSAIVEREAKLEGKNMFLIMAPRATPLGPPRFVHLKTDTAHHEVETVDHHDDHETESADTEVQGGTDADAVATIGGASA